jgi:iron uptake system component EfeO
MTVLRRVLLATSSIAIVAACSSPAVPSAPGSAETGVVVVNASEYKFDPATITVPAGSVTFRVTNSGAEEHEFEIFEGETIVDEVEGLVPGITRDLTVDLAAGSYTYVCKLPGHEEQGMTGTLTVS